MTNYKQLNKLIDKTNSIRENVKYREINITDCTFSYMPTKKTSFIGYKQGYSDILIRNQKGIKVSDKISSTTKNFLKFIKNQNGELIQVESYVNGKIDCLFQVYWIKNIRYLFPFSSSGKYYPTYTYVTKYKSNNVTEEYMVSGNQMIYETYSYKLNKDIKYSYINYVSNGKVPVLEERKGKFTLNPLIYKENYNYNWFDKQ